jgi:hypothetical protein
VAQNFCENLDKGITSCYGSCYLEKQLKEESENEKHQEFPKTEIEILNYLQESDVKIPECVFFNVDKGYSEFICNYSFTTVTTIFHPPKLYT